MMDASDFFYEAKPIQRLAQSLQKDSADLKHADSVVHHEVSLLCTFTRKASIELPLHRLLRARLEYLICVLFASLREGGSAISWSSIIRPLFDLMKNMEDRIQWKEQGDGHSFAGSEYVSVSSNIAVLMERGFDQGVACLIAHEADGQNVESEESLMDSSRTQWLDMCFTSLTLLVVGILKKDTACLSLLDVSLADSIAMGQSNHWQLQLLSMGLVVSLLRSEAECDADGSQQQNNPAPSQSTTSRRTASIRSSSPSSDGELDETVDISTANKSSKNLMSKSSSTPGMGMPSTRQTSKSSKLTTSAKQPSSSGKLEKSTSSRGKTVSSSSSRGSEETTVKTSPVRVSTSAGTGTADAADGSLSDVPNTSSLSGPVGTSTKDKLPLSRAGAMPLRKSQSSLSASFRSTVARFQRCVDDICKSGYLRTIMWLMLHQREIVRSTAAEVIGAMLGKDTNKEGGSGTGSGSDMWACCVEQGLIPQLEYIRQGHHIHQPNLSLSSSTPVAGHNSSHILFPEDRIRNLVEKLLNMVVQKVQAQPSIFSRLSSALLHSGNSKLRANILSGLFYLCGRSKEIGRQLCSQMGSFSEKNIAAASTVQAAGASTKGIAALSRTSSTRDTTSVSASAQPSVSGTGEELSVTTPRITVLHEMLVMVVRDPADFRSVMALLQHFLEHALRCQQSSAEITSPKAAAIEMSTQTGNVSGPSSIHNSVAAVPGLEPMVLISDPSSGRITRMVCPALNIIEAHSTALHTLLKNAMDRQIQSALQVLTSSKSGANGTDNTADIEKRLMGALKNLSDSHFVTLFGSYNIWQEVFSHMVDTFLMQASVERMNLLGVIEALALCRQFGMRAMGLRYSEALVQRLSTGNFIQIFQASVGIYKPAKYAVASQVPEIDDAPLYLHLYQALHCIKYLDAYMDRIVTIWKPKDNAFVIDCVHRVMLCLFLTE